MTNKTEFTIEGGQEIARLLKELPLQYQKKGLLHAFRAGATVIKKQIEINARAAGVAERVIKGLKIMRPRFKGAGQVILIRFRNTGSSRGVKNTLSTPALASVQEFGTEVRTRKGKLDEANLTYKGGSTGRIIARPFYRPAFDGKSKEAVKTITDLTEENLTIIARQLAAKHKVSLAKKFRK